MAVAVAGAWFAAMPLLRAAELAALHVEVRDASGAAIAASGAIENAATGVRHSFRTDAQGAHSFAGLPLGRYRLRVEKEGFADYRANVDLNSAEPVTHAVTLAVGARAYTLEVVSTTPLPGLDRSLDEIPAPTQAADHVALGASGALDISDFLNRRLNNVFVNEIQGNPLQADLNYRGYSASPLLGTPQGVSVYLDGMRLNQPFGDVVSWDLIPRVAISEMAMIPGSNPLFGLNALGGALSLRTKDGAAHPGTALQLSGGSFGRKLADFEHGGSTVRGLHWFVAGNLFFEDGWRETSPSNVRQFFGKLGWQRARTSIALSLGFANNALIGNGLQEGRFLERDYRAVYTKPDVTAHRSPFVQLTVRHSFTSKLSFAGSSYFRHIRTHTLNGDMNEDSLDQSVYQPSAAEQAALRAAGYTGFPQAGAAAANTPFPFWRCIGNVLLRDEPAEKCNGLLNRSRLQQRSFGFAGQVNRFSSRNQLTIGAAYDGGSIGFSQSAELGYINPDRSITGVGAYGDGVTGGDVDGEPFDTRVNLAGRIHSGSVYATDTLTLPRRISLTASGRFNRTVIDNRDLIRPRAGTGSLTGRHDFNRFNPAIGVTWRAAEMVSLFAGVTEGSRAPTSIELGCADPAAPCKLPNAMAGDPPLKQVVARTYEAGLRGTAARGLHWTASWFQVVNRDDILFVASEQTGFGYFKNFDRTRRRGVEFDLNSRIGRVTLGGGYTLLEATFQSSEEVSGTGNSSNNNAQRGRRGIEGEIEIEPGNRIPLVPRHMVKAYADVQATTKFVVSLGVVGISSSFARGNENNAHRADGEYYLDSGISPGYVVANAGARYQVNRRVRLFVQVNNLLDRRYYSGAQLGATGFTDAASFVARPLPAVNGVFPVRQSTFFAPGAPRGAWVGLHLRF